MAVKQSQFEIPFLKDPATLTTFENGYQFIYVPKKGEVFNLNTWVKTGSIHETAQNSGVSHFLEHLMFKGTERFAPGEFDSAMENMGAVINAATWKDFTFYYITGIRGPQQANFQKALDMHADMMLHAAMPDEEIGQVHNPNDPYSEADKRERGVVIEEIGMRNDQPWTKVFNLLNHAMYVSGHPYQRDVIGTKEIIAAIDRSAIVNYYNTWYSAPNMCTIVVGDFDYDRLVDQVGAAFDFSHRPEHAGVALDAVDPALLTSEDERFCQMEGNYQTSFLLMGFHGPYASDLKETIALDVACRVLGEGRSSRLYNRFIERADQPIMNMITLGQSRFKLGNVLYLQANFNTAQHKSVIADIEEEVSHFTKERPITQEEFDRAVKSMKVEFAETSETASGIAESLGESFTLTSQFDSYSQYLPLLSQLRREDVERAAHRWLVVGQHYSAVLVPKS